MTRWRNDRTFSKLVRSLLGQLCVVLPGGGSARSLDCTAGFIMKKSRVGMTTQRRSYRSFSTGRALRITAVLSLYIDWGHCLISCQVSVYQLMAHRF